MRRPFGFDGAGPEIPSRLQFDPRAIGDLKSQDVRTPEGLAPRGSQRAPHNDLDQAPQTRV